MQNLNKYLSEIITQTSSFMNQATPLEHRFEDAGYQGLLNVFFVIFKFGGNKLVANKNLLNNLLSLHNPNTPVYFEGIKKYYANEYLLE